MQSAELDTSSCRACQSSVDSQATHPCAACKSSATPAAAAALPRLHPVAGGVYWHASSQQRCWVLGLLASSANQALHVIAPTHAGWQLNSASTLSSRLPTQIKQPVAGNRSKLRSLGIWRSRRHSPRRLDQAQCCFTQGDPAQAQQHGERLLPPESCAARAGPCQALAGQAGGGEARVRCKRNLAGGRACRALGRAAKQQGKHAAGALQGQARAEVDVIFDQGEQRGDQRIAAAPQDCPWGSNQYARSNSPQILLNAPQRPPVVAERGAAGPQTSLPACLLAYSARTPAADFTCEHHPHAHHS